MPAVTDMTPARDGGKGHGNSSPERQSEEKQHLTIRDIASMTGFSRSTVSLAINDDPRINDETKHSIMNTIKRVGYQPNAAAQAIGARNGKAGASRKPTVREEKVYKVSQARLRNYIGNYTERRVSLKAGSLYYYHHFYKTEHKLTPVSLDTFAVDGLNWFQMRFVCDETGKPIKIIGMYLDREPDESLRDR